MKQLILFILSGVSLLWSEPKVIGIFGDCSWSQELREDVWETPSFQALLTAAGIQKEEKPAQNEPETPMLILISSQGEEIGRLGFLVIPTEKYVSLFQEMLSIHELNIDKLNLSQLLHYYRKCQVLNMKACEEKILTAGLSLDSGTDFLLEQYAKIAKKHPKQAKKVKAEIRIRKPNSTEVEWQLSSSCFSNQD